jgi:hypothetical protein
MFSTQFQENSFNFIQSQAKTDEQFYSMCLNKGNRIDKSKLAILLDKLSIPKDVRYVILDEKRVIDKEELSDKSELDKENKELKEKIKELTKPLVITE